MVYYKLNDEDAFGRIIHHETDSESYTSFINRMTKTHQEIANRQEKLSLEEMNRAWQSWAPERYSSGDISRIPGSAPKVILSQLKETKKLVSFFLYGAPQSGKTYIGYAILKYYFIKGIIKTKEIKVFSQEDIKFWSTAGFVGKNAINEIFDNKYKVYLVEGIKKENPDFWEQFIAHVYNNSLTVIFTSELGTSELSQILTAGATKRLHSIVNNSNIYIDQEEKPDVLY